nr:hypothetical protein [Parafrankia sp. BMG5.11]
MTRTRLPLTTISPPPLDRAKVSAVLPCRLVWMSLTDWPSNPPTLAETVYGPPVTRPEATKRPSAPVVIVRVAPVRVSVMVTVAPASGLPSASVTVPSMPEVIC